MATAPEPRGSGACHGIIPPMKTESLPDPRRQAEKFADLARELECDESEEAFDERLRKVAGTRIAADIWTVDFAKVGAGFTVHPWSGQKPGNFPIWPSQDEVRSWLAANGYRMLNDDPDKWVKAA